MKKLLLMLSLGLALFADKVVVKDDIKFPKEAVVLEETESYTVLCIRGNEYILDLQDGITQSFEKVTYTVTGVGYIPVQVPIQCKGK